MAIDRLVKAERHRVVDHVRVARDGEAVYQSLRKQLEVEHKGKFVLINVQTGEYVLGETTEEVTQCFWQSYGKVPGYLRGIGFIAHA